MVTDHDSYVVTYGAVSDDDDLAPGRVVELSPEEDRYGLVKSRQTLLAACTSSYDGGLRGRNDCSPTDDLPPRELTSSSNGSDG